LISPGIPYFNAPATENLSSSFNFCYIQLSVPTFRYLTKKMVAYFVNQEEESREKEVITDIM
jgi:hypothetical protein